MEKTCFRWDDTPKSIYFYYMFGITLIGVVFAFIIMFNLTRPQTKRKNIANESIRKNDSDSTNSYLKITLNYTKEKLVF